MNQIPLCVMDYMTRDLVTVPPHTDIAQVVRLLIEHDISGLLVVEADSRLVGVVTERDCIAVAASSGYYEEWGGPVSKFMSTPVETVGPDDNLLDVAARMAKSIFRRFPVVEDGRVIGLLTRRDVLRVIDKGSWSAVD